MFIIQTIWNMVYNILENESQYDYEKHEKNDYKYVEGTYKKVNNQLQGDQSDAPCQLPITRR